MIANRRYGDVIAHSFGLHAAPNVVTSAVSDSAIGITRISLGEDRLGMSPPVPPEDTFILAVYLTPLERHEMWSKGRPAIVQGYARNAMRIVNLEGEFSANILEPHEAMTAYMPRRVLESLSDEAGEPRIDQLRCSPGVVDPVVAGLISALRPIFQEPLQASQLFVDHVSLVLCSHLMRHYGGRRTAVALPKGGLTRYQFRRATEIMASRSADTPSLAELAEACGLSRGHFVRAFKASSGVTPHFWLQRYRIDKACAMLRETTMPIAQIATRCGFADQSHLTRIFSRLTGDTPAAWRRARL